MMKERDNMTYNMSKKNDVSDMIFNGIKGIAKRRKTTWVGTMTELGMTLQNRVQSDNWPGSASALRVALNKVVNRLRNAGVSVRFTRSNDQNRTRLVKIS